jgi:hypothetical protein
MWDAMRLVEKVEMSDLREMLTVSLGVGQKSV